MHSNHPLQLPEILSKVAEYVPKRRYPVCLRISKAWYQVFIRLVWEDCDVHDFRLVQSHAHLIKTLKIDLDLNRLEYGPESVPILPNLQSLSLGGSDSIHQELLSRHTWIHRLAFLYNDINSDHGLWVKLQDSFVHLRELDLQCVGLSEEEVDVFWQLCTRLESLAFSYAKIPCRGRLSDMEFPRLKSLQAAKLVEGDDDITMDFMAKCPNLTLLGWDHYVRDDHYDRFLELMVARTWPDLDSLVMRWLYVPEDDIAKIIPSIQRIIRLEFGLPTTLGPSSLDLLQLHFPTLRKVNFKSQYGPHHCCPIAITVLTSCPTLEAFCSSRIYGTSIVEGKPWVCLGLKDLDVEICFYPDTIRDTQAQVLDQLSKLTQLDSLIVWDRQDYLHGSYEVPLDLRLKYGLGKLSTLQSLRHINWGISDQWMGEQECQWMLDNWMCLKYVSGRLNASDFKLDDLLSDRLRKQRITKYTIGRHKIEIELQD
ncbi:hypothetical protein BGX31_006633 [Mortierella sp. GBA43]|nr:hypothetical protein BGX31_006633 [Mortierella sp. GBA43]